MAGSRRENGVVKRNLSIALVVGARPNFVKAAPLLRAFDDRAPGRMLLVNTGQHYDDAMSRSFFRDLDIRSPDVVLEVGSGPHGEQTGRLIKELEAVFAERRPDRVMVVGDVNSTMAGALAAAKLHIPIDHVEAGLRSFDRSMPEEVNRVVTDAIAARYFVSEPAGIGHLKSEGKRSNQIHHVGNVMIDSLVHAQPKIDSSLPAERFGLAPGTYGVVTLHRPSNVDDPKALQQVMVQIARVANLIPLIFPVHPRTRARLAGIEANGVHLVEPLGYLAFLALLTSARVVITDSGGVQEETTFLRIPCLTLRSTTERPVTVETGSNRLLGDDPSKLYSAVRSVLHGPRRVGRVPRLWDGRAAERIASVVLRRLRR